MLKDKVVEILKYWNLIEEENSSLMNFITIVKVRVLNRTTCYSPQQNSIIERKNNAFWVEAIIYMVFLLKKCPKTIFGRTLKKA